MNKLGQLEYLRSLYRSTFEEWALQVGRLDEIRDLAHEGGAVGGTQEGIASAEARYRDVRNQLASEMAAGKEDRRL